MFCEDFDKFNKVYTMKGGPRGQGTICFLVSRIAKLRAQLEVANAKIAELEKKLIKQQFHEAYKDYNLRTAAKIDMEATLDLLRYR
jgi:hypothetical protein